jgi:hypothetical protein
MHRTSIILSALALIVSLTASGAYAASQMSGSTIMNGTIGVAKLTPKAIKQLKGNKGDTGARGATGAPGLVGAAGAAGLNGSAGATGLTGGFNPAKVTYVTGATVTVPTAAYPGDPNVVQAAQANCPAGSKAVGGGFFSSITHAGASAPFADGHGWFVIVENDTSIPVGVNAYVACAAA